MKRKPPQRIGPMPTPQSVGFIPDRIPVISQEKFHALITKFMAIIRQLDPPIPRKRGGYLFKTNPKWCHDYFLLKGPDGSGRPILREQLEGLVSASDWERFAKSIIVWLKEEAQDVNEQQHSSVNWHAIQKACAPVANAFKPKLPQPIQLAKAWYGNNGVPRGDNN